MVFVMLIHLHCISSDRWQSLVCKSFLNLLHIEQFFLWLGVVNYTVAADSLALDIGQ